MFAQAEAPTSTVSGLRMAVIRPLGAAILRLRLDIRTRSLHGGVLRGLVALALGGLQGHRREGSLADASFVVGKLFLVFMHTFSRSSRRPKHKGPHARVQHHQPLLDRGPPRHRCDSGDLPGVRCASPAGVRLRGRSRERVCRVAADGRQLPGPDAVPFVAWRAQAPIVTPLVQSATSQVMDGEAPLPPMFNKSGQPDIGELSLANSEAPPAPDSWPAVPHLCGYGCSVGPKDQGSWSLRRCWG